MAGEESTYTAPDGFELYSKTWRPNGSPKATLIFIHGFSDHISVHDPLFLTLTSNGITVHAYDQRGWGKSVRSPNQKGLTGPTSQVMDDITGFIKHVLAQKESQGVPLFLMGHSMGGQEVLTYIATGPKDVVSKIRGFLAEAPYIALDRAAQPSKVTIVLGRLAGRILPHRQMVNKLDATKISRDPDVCKEYEQDKLCHDTGTLEGLAGMLDRAEALESGKVVVSNEAGEGGKTRLWVSHGTGDKICDFQACKKWYEDAQIEDKEMQVYEGWYHKLHAEPGEDKIRFSNDVANWILDRCGSAEQADGDSKPKL